MSVTSCPPAAELEQLFLGGLQVQEAQAHEEHILACGSCLEKLKTLVPAPDTLVGWLSADTHCDGFASSPVVADLRKQLKALRPASASSVSQGAAVIRITCTSCCKTLSIKDTLAGKKIKCPGCGQVSVPMPVASPADRADDPTLPPEPAPASKEQPSAPAGNRPTHSSSSWLDATLNSKAPESGTGSNLTDFLSPAQAADELGRLGKYRILKVLGQGGMGVVFKAEDPHLKRTVALKAMLPTLAASASAGQRFLREAQSVAAVEHDHIVRIHEVAEERGVPFLAMEFLKGEPLDERLQREHGLPVSEVLRIGREIAEGLAAAHATGLIHRDIKPANIWLEAPRVRVKILDFGLARSAQQESGLTQQGAIIGTPAYMAPEQGRGDPVDGRCDLFSLGVILYRLCCGKQPFHGTDTVSTLLAVATDKPAPPLQANPDLPPELSELVMQLLAKDPAQRPASADAVVQTLQALEKKLVRQQEAREETVALEATPLKRAAAPPRRRLPAIVGALVLLAGLVGVGLWASGLIRISSDQGDYVIDTDDPDFSFQVSKGGVTLEDRKTKRTYQLKVLRQDQAKGEHDLEVTDTAADLSFKSKTFTIKRGQQVALKAWFERKKVAAAQQPATTLHDAWIKALAALPLDKQGAALAAKMTERPPGFEGAFLKAMAAMTADRQVVLVAVWLKERNPGFDGKVTHKIEAGVVTSLEVPPLAQDLTPLRALTGLRTLTCRSTVGWDNKAESDAAVLDSLKALEKINGKPVAQFRKDIAAKRADFKEWLNLVPSLTAKQQAAAVAARIKEHNPDFDGRVIPRIEDGVVTEIAIWAGNVSDLSPLRALIGLRSLSGGGRKSGGGILSDLSPLKDMKLTSLALRDTPVTDLVPLKDMKLTSLTLISTRVTDLSPLKDNTTILTLTLGGWPVSDLSPLKDNRTLTTLILGKTSVADLSPLKNTLLTSLTLGNTRVTDLSPLKDLKLTSLDIRSTLVRDLSPLKGMPLAELNCKNSKVTDLSPLKDLPLTKIECDFQPDRDTTILRAIKTLNTINGKSAAEFWKGLEKQ